MQRYIVVFDTYVYWVIDTSIDDGEPCNVDGALTRVEAELKCAELNAKAGMCGHEYGTRGGICELCGHEL